jgi:hypothetical protein
VEHHLFQKHRVPPWSSLLVRYFFKYIFCSTNHKSTDRRATLQRGIWIQNGVRYTYANIQIRLPPAWILLRKIIIIIIIKNNKRLQTINDIVLLHIVFSLSRRIFFV